MTPELTLPEAESPTETDSEPVTETDTEPDHERSEPEPLAVDVPSLQGTARLRLPPHATDSEAAAVAAAVAAHLSASDDGEKPTPTVDRWKLAERFGSRRAARIRGDCTHGDAWKLAGRCQQSW